MIKYVISREKQDDWHCLKVVALFDSAQEAFDALYRGAKRYGLDLQIDNSRDPHFGFLISQIYLQVGSWRYSVTKEDTEDPYGMLYGWE